MGEMAEKLKLVRLPYAAAVIVAGGSGSRFGGDKLMADLGGMPVLARTLLAFERAEAVRAIVVAARADAVEQVQDLGRQFGISKLTAVTAGGVTRSGSCLAGVLAVPPEAELIAIHDGARPLVTEDVITNALWTAYRHTAALPAIPVRDTIKQAKDGLVTHTPDRSVLFAAQTPQCFQADLIRAALLDAAENAPEVTDDCLAVERIGGRIYLAKGSEENIKITTPLDLKIAETILVGRSGYEDRARI